MDALEAVLRPFPQSEGGECDSELLDVLIMPVPRHELSVVAPADLRLPHPCFSVRPRERIDGLFAPFCLTERTRGPNEEEQQSLSGRSNKINLYGASVTDC